MPKLIWFNGKLVEPQQAVVSVFDHGLLYGDGVFEGIRVYHGRIFKLASHLRRLNDSAKSIRLPIPYPVSELEVATHQTVSANDCTNGYIRLCVTRGCGTLGINPFTCKDPSTFIIADAIALYPQNIYRQGLSVISSSVMRNHPAALSPRIKSLNYLNNILAKIEAIDAGMLEAVMFNHQGYVAECTGDNLFTVIHPNGTAPVLTTPPLHAGALEGVTMNVVLELAQQVGMQVMRTDLTKHDLYVADEIFLTGTAAELVPVISLDGRTIGDGKPGKVTAQLTDCFHQLVGNDAPED